MADSIMTTGIEKQCMRPDVLTAVNSKITCGLIGYGAVYSLLGYNTMLSGTNCSGATCSLHLPSKTRQ